MFKKGVRGVLICQRSRVGTMVLENLIGRKRSKKGCG